MSDQEMDALNSTILGTVTVRAPHQADYEHNFHLSNNQDPPIVPMMTDYESTAQRKGTQDRKL